MPQRLVWVDVSKGAAMAAVVLWHASAQVQLTHGGTDWAVAGATLAPVRIPLFFLASGILARSALTRPWRRLLRDRVLLFVWLYLVWTVLISALRVVFTNRDPGPLVESALVVESDLWYLVALPVFHLVARLARPLPVAMQLGAAGAMSVLVGLSPHVSLGINGAGTYLVYFLIGSLLADRIVPVVDGVRASLTVLLVTVWVGATVGQLVHPVVSPAVFATFGPLLALPAALRLAVHASRSAWSVPLARLGRTTLPVYVMHFPIVAVLDRIVPWPDARWVPAVAPPLLAVAAILAALAVHVVLRHVPGLFGLPSRPARRPFTAE